MKRGRRIILATVAAFFLGLVLIGIFSHGFAAASAAWVARDSARLMKSVPPADRKPLSRLAAGPKGWTIGTLFLWPIYFPAYLSARARYGGEGDMALQDRL